MNGILVINKEKNYTSRDVVNVISKQFHTKKVGHTGTLDPIATGVLVICLGKALKVAELITSEEKEYEATMTLGYETDTLDVTGKITKKKDVIATKERIIQVLKAFQGEYLQEVPLYSAVKVKGKRLYEYGRNDEEVALPKRMVNIKEISLVRMIDDNTIVFRCLVSKGTYIRSLIRDIGYKLDTYGTMVELKRIKQGNFKIDNSYTLEDIKNNNYQLLKIEDVVDLPRLEVDNTLAKRIINGNKIPQFFKEEKVMLFNKNHELLAIYQQDNHGMVKPWKMF